MKLIHCFTLLVLFSSGVVSAELYENCKIKYESKHDVEECLNNLIEEQKKELKVLLAETNVIVVSQEEYHISPGLSAGFAKEQVAFENYMDLHCELYLGAIGAYMGTGSAVSSLECQSKMLHQRIEALQSVVQ